MHLQMFIDKINFVNQTRRTVLVNGSHAAAAGTGASHVSLFRHNHQRQSASILGCSKPPWMICLAVMMYVRFPP